MKDESLATCKQCTAIVCDRDEIVEYTRRRPLVLAEIEGQPSHVTAAVVDGGVFCSRQCLVAYLTESER